ALPAVRHDGTGDGLDAFHDRACMRIRLAVRASDLDTHGDVDHRVPGEAERAAAGDVDARAAVNMFCTIEPADAVARLDGADENLDVATGQVRIAREARRGRYVHVRVGAGGILDPGFDAEAAGDRPHGVHPGGSVEPRLTTVPGDGPDHVDRAVVIHVDEPR